MPGVIAGALISAFNITSITLATMTAFVQGAIVLGTMAYQASQKKRAQKKAIAQFNAAQVDRLANLDTTTAARELVLGRVRKGGPVFYRATTGQNKTIFYMCMALAAHEVDAMEEVWLGEKPVSLDASGNVTSAPYYSSSVDSGTTVADGSGIANLPATFVPGSVNAYTGTTGGPGGDMIVYPATIAGTVVTTTPGATVSYQYTVTASKAQIRLIPGTDSQAADAELQAAFPGVWTAAHRARGVAYLIGRFEYDETAFPSSLPSVTVVLRGAKLYDPRENRVTNSALSEWSAYVTGAATGTATVVSDPVYGSVLRLTKTGGAAGDRFGRSITFTGLTGSAYSAGAMCRVNVAGSNGYPVYVDAAALPSGLVVATSTLSGTEATGVWQQHEAHGAGTLAGGGAMYAWVEGPVGSSIDIALPQLNSGAHLLPHTPTTGSARSPITAWSENPALQMRHVYTHANFGKRAAVSQSEEDRIIAAANACDRSTTYTLTTGESTTTQLFRSALVVAYGTQASSVFDDLAQAMGGMWAYAGRELMLRAGVWVPPVMDLVESDLVMTSTGDSGEDSRPIGIQVHRERNRKFNTVAPRIWDRDREYKQLPVTPLAPGLLITRDGASLVEPVDFEAIFFAPQALHVAGVMLRDARDPLTITVNTKLRAYPLELFDVVTLTIVLYGFAAKPFIVLGRTWAANGDLQYTLKETSEAIFTKDAAFDPQGYAANTNLPNPWYVPQPGPLIVSSGTSELLRLSDGTIVIRVRVTWPELTDASVLQNGQIEVQYRDVLNAGEAWKSERVEGSETQVVLDGLTEGSLYHIRARARNTIAIGQWSVQALHKVLGKSEPPGEVTGVGVTQDIVLWTPVDDIDLAGYEIRALPGTTATWSLGVRVHEGVVTDTPYAFRTRLIGVQTVMVAAIDTSGNYGAPGSATLDFGTIDEINVAQTYDYAAAGFPGDITDATVSGTDLVADLDPAADVYSIGGDDFYYHDGGDIYGGAVYQPMAYVATFSPLYGGGSIVLDYTLSGSRASVEWRVDGATVGDVYSSDNVYGDDPIYGASGGFIPYIGEVTSVAGQSIQFRVSIDGGPSQGQITDMVARLQMPQLSQVFTAQAINSGGTRLDPALGAPPVDWIAVEEATFTIYVDGSGAVAGRVIDFDPDLGPMVQTINAAGTAVSSAGHTVRVSGF